MTWLALASIPLGLGAIGISWDALNHHIYLGWTADQPRFDRDFLAASYQAFQFPYLYWPVYKLSGSGISGAGAGVVLASLYWLAVPAVWMMARVCIPGGHWFDAAMRFAAVVLAFLSGVVLSMFDSTSNDLLAAVPLVWAMAFALEPLDTQRPHVLAARSWILLSGLLAGVSIACKLSNGPLAVLLPMLWILPSAPMRTRLANAALGGVAMVGGFFIAYGYWGRLLWLHFGNPIYPFYDPLFAPVRALLGWQP
ncbi:MAG: hypothetical protein Q8R01_12175 [Ramlibacter sp.]|nr:hypothetical protein [Ramlibacter sp.]